jgi:hypothetical protein
MKNDAHLSERELVAHVLGDEDHPEPGEAHLARCGRCQAELAQLQATLAAVNDETLPVPYPEEYPDRVWAAVRPRLETPPRSGWREWAAAPRLALAGGVLGIIVVAFLAGRLTTSTGLSGPDSTGPRAIRAAVGDHLERSEMILVEVANTDARVGGIDLSADRQRARDLLEVNRLYRRSARRAGDPAVAAVLDELERVLIEIANSSTEPSPERLAELQRLIADQGILFKVRVMEAKVKSAARRDAPARSGSVVHRSRKVTT